MYSEKYTFQNQEGDKMATSTKKFVEYMCSQCGKKQTRPKAMGRPDPGKCPRKTGNKPHSWVKNREL